MKNIFSKNFVPTLFSFAVVAFAAQAFTHGKYVEKATYKSNEPSDSVRSDELLPLNDDKVAVLKNHSFSILNSEGQYVGGFDIEAEASFRAFRRLERNRLLIADSKGLIYIADSDGNLVRTFSLGHSLLVNDELYHPLPSGHFYVSHDNHLELYDSNFGQKICELYPQAVGVPFDTLSRVEGNAISIFQEISEDNKLIVLGDRCEVVQKFDLGPKLVNSAYRRLARYEEGIVSIDEQSLGSGGTWSPARLRLFSVTASRLVPVRDFTLPVTYRIDQIDFDGLNRVLIKHEGSAPDFGTAYEVFNIMNAPRLEYAFTLPDTFLRVLSFSATRLLVVNSGNTHVSKLYVVHPTSVTEVYEFQSVYNSPEVKLMDDLRTIVATPVGSQHDVTFLMPSR